MSFKSDFSLIPIIKKDNPNWEYRPATWTSDIDPFVHDLFDGINDDMNDDNIITYNRQKIRNNMLQHCTIVKENDKIIMKPGDGFDYDVKRISEHNKINNNDIPHNMLCIICLNNKKTHAIIPCFHVVACSMCAQILYNQQNKRCPLCNVDFTDEPKKLYF